MEGCNLSISISHLVALVTLDIPGGYITAHYNNTTHTETCLFPKTNTTVSFYRPKLQRHYLAQVTIGFHKREFDYIDIYKMNVVKKRVQGLEVKKATIFQSSLLLFNCVKLRKFSNISGPVCSSIKCNDEPLLLPQCSQADPKTVAHCGNLKANVRCGTETKWTAA